MTAFPHSFFTNGTVDSESLHSLEEQCGFKLPKDYSGFLRQYNGGEGSIGQASYVVLWPLQDLMAMNNAYEVTKYAPGLFLFGSDGGGEAFAFDMRSGTNSVLSVPLVGMDLRYARVIAEDFSSFLSELLKS